MKQLLPRLALGAFTAGLVFFMAQPSFATVSGDLITGGNGTLTVSSTSLTFTPNDTTGYSTEVASGTNVTFAGCTSGVLMSPGCLTQGEGVDINGGNPITTLGPIPSFLTFQNNPSLTYSLTGYEPGSSNTDCAALTVGQSCSVFTGSPVVLTLESGNNTAAALGVYGTASDGSGTPSPWTGEFTATVNNQTPAQIQTTISSGDSITHSYSGQFTASTVPEPRLTLLGALAGMMLFAFLVHRRKKEA